MSELVTTAATVLVPFLSAGAGTVAAGTAEEAGADLYRSAMSLLARLGGRVHGEDVAAVTGALDEAVADGDVDESELRRLVELSERATVRGQVNYGSIEAKNVFMGNTKIKKFKA